MVRYSLRILGSGSEPQLPVSHMITRSTTNTLAMILYLYNHFFSLLVQYTINDMRYSTLYYKIGFSLADFAQA